MKRQPVCKACRCVFDHLIDNMFCEDCASKPPETFAHKLILARTKTKLTQENFAKVIQTPKATLSNWELGHFAPQPERHEAIAQLLLQKGIVL